MSTASPMYEWKDLPWRKLERKVFKLQKRIYQASSRGETEAVRKLQRLLLKSQAAKLLAVRRVSQDNQGKKTPGVDGIASLTPKDRLELSRTIRIDGKAAPVRRVYIPKPGSDEKRPLGIPTMQDRALQALVKLALEPEWEAKFEPNSYGFRLGRSVWDAIDAIYKGIRSKAKYVLDADICKCFDKINHDVLIKKVNTSPYLARQIRAWLKAGVLDGDTLFPTEEGTPQGGVISPLLANIALHGMESVITDWFPRLNKNGHYKSGAILIRYADDFVILHEDLQVAQQCQDVITSWLKLMGLELKPSKTRIVHTLERVNEQPADFDFLGFNIRQYVAGKSKEDRTTNGQGLGYRTSIQPSKEAVRRHVQALREIIDENKNASQENLIRQLNPIITGWANYYHTVVSSKIFSKLDHILFLMLWAWAKRRHPNKNKRWIANKYWGIDEVKAVKWKFQPFKGTPLYNHKKVKITRHVKVQGNRSPYDGDWAYWSGRQGRYPGVSAGVATLLKRQRGKCNWCGLYFKPGDILENDHIDPNGSDALPNRQMLHRHCHDVKTAKDRYRI